MSARRCTGTFSRPADNTAYTAGDIIANSTTAGLVVPITFPVTPRSGWITGARCTVAPASGNVVITAFDFDLLIFLSTANIPFAAGSYPADNTALTLTAAMYRELIGVLPFANGAWRNPLGALTAGAVGFQAVAPSARVQYPYDLGNVQARDLIGVVQVKAAWTPTGVVNQFDFELDIEFGDY